MPVTAVRQGASGDFVYVVGEDRTVTLRNVDARQSSTNDVVAITNGLRPASGWSPRAATG